MINFELSDEQKMIRDTVAAFARDRVRPAARPADETGAIPPELVKMAGGLGLTRSAIPERFGGYGDERSAISGAVVAEELAFGDLAIAMHILAPRLLAFPILEMGTDDQRTRFLPRFGRDDFTPAAAAVMEPRFDFDLMALDTLWRDNSSGYVLNGAKCVVPLAAEADTILVYAGSDKGNGMAGVQGFLIPRGTAGMAISEREKNMGIKALATYQVMFKDCHLPRDARVGGEQGANFTRLTSESRVALAAMAVGVARAAYEYARDYAKERKAFGVPIATKQAVAFMLADMAIEIDAMRLLVWEAASRLDKHEDALKETYLARNYAAASVLKVTDNAVQVLGGHGYIREHPVEMFLRNARGFSSFEGLATV
jgi:acyl-CoA dehydrogenase